MFTVTDTKPRGRTDQVTAQVTLSNPAKQSARMNLVVLESSVYNFGQKLINFENRLDSLSKQVED